jgi:SAM-dependent methyltransferase
LSRQYADPPVTTSLPKDASAQQRWTAALASWEIPEHILAAAPESPWGFPPRLFHAVPVTSPAAPNISDAVALEVLPPGGTVIDVGVGAGRSSLALGRQAGLIIGVDPSETMLERFAEAAEAADTRVETVQGTWPEAAARAGVADVVVCHHVVYNVSDLAPFIAALGRAARRRVVVEMTATHPQTSLNHLWRELHGIQRPEGPTYSDLLAVLRELDRSPELRCWSRSAHEGDIDRTDVVAFARRRLCLPAERDPEIDALLGDDYVVRPRDVATIWWAGESEA